MAILFAEDWDKYPNATVHYETKNESFLRFASLLKSMNVKNHAWPLALVNPALRHVDPHDEANLTEEQKTMIAAEAKINPFYFLREIARCPVQGGNPVPLSANRGNMSFIWLMLNHITVLLILIRQSGKSLIAALLEVYLSQVLCINTEINQLTQNETLRGKTMRTIKECMDALPSYMDLRHKRLDSNNTEMITVNALGNSIKMHLSSSNPKQANKVGRGLTSPFLLTDEFATVENVEIALDAAMPTMIAARTAAKKAGTPYAIGFMTTAGKKDDREGAYAYKFLQECLPWSEMLYDCLDEADLIKVISNNNRARTDDLGEIRGSGKVQVACVFNHRQMGLSDEWLMDVKQSLSLSEDAANRDLFNVWTDGSAASPIPVDLAKIVRSSEREPLYTEITPDRYILRWYIPKEQIESFMARGQFVMSLDISDGIGQDDISLVIRDTEDGAEIAAGTYNMLNLQKFFAWICALIVKYKTMLTIVEMRSQARSLVDYLIEHLPSYGEDPFKRLFNWIVQNPGEHRDRFDVIKQPHYARPPGIYEQYKRYFGFSTSSSGETSRDELYSTTLIDALTKTGHVTRDSVLIKQILALEYRNGRIDHPAGGHDDLVIGHLIAHWYITKGKNIDFYGHNSRRNLSRLLVKTNQTREQQFADQEQARLRQQIQAIYDRLQNERDDAIVMKLEHQLRILDRSMQYGMAETFSMDAMIQQAKEIRLQRRRSPQMQASRRHGIDPATSQYHGGVFSDQPLTTRELMRRRY